jgi:predicted SAM-dependent methyltransferase
VDVLVKLGINAACMDFTKLDLKPRASVISMCDVLEHMPFPIMGLTAAHRNLADDGLLLISLPNIDSHLWKLLDQNNVNPYWMEMEHFHNFGKSSLFRSLEQTGFIPEKFGVSYRYRACMEVIARKR